MRGGFDSRPVKRLYTLKESAVYLGRTVWAIRHLVWRGVLPCVRIGRRMQIDVQDLDSLIERYKTSEQ
jgi:excisionase family DNA binding protein